MGEAGGWGRRIVIALNQMVLQTTRYCENLPTEGKDQIPFRPERKRNVEIDYLEGDRQMEILQDQRDTNEYVSHGMEWIVETHQPQKEMEGGEFGNLSH